MSKEIALEKAELWASSKLIDTGIINGNLIDIKGQIINGNQTPIPYANPSTGVFGYYTPSTGMIQIMTLSDRSTQLFYITQQFREKRLFPFVLCSLNRTFAP